jgi:hypothetical protein
MFKQTKDQKMELNIGTKIRYTSAAGTREAIIKNISIGPTAKPGFLNTWVTLEIPVQEGVKFKTTAQIAGADTFVKNFKVELI